MHAAEPGHDAHERDVQVVVAELCAALAAGDEDRLAPLVDPDVVGFGAAADQVFTDRAGLAAVSRAMAVPDLAPDEVRAGLADSGASGWFWAVPPVAGASARASQVRVSGLLHRAGAGWSTLHLHVSEALPNEELPADPTAMPAPSPLGQQVAADAAALPDLLRRSLGVQRLEVVARRSDVVAIGTDPHELYEGAEPYLRAFEPMRDQIRAMEPTLTADFPGGIRARLTADGRSGYLATNVASALSGHRLPTMRVGWIFTEFEGQWRPVCDHHSFPRR